MGKTRFSRILSIVTLGLGLWLMLSPAVLGYPSLEATAQQTIIGIIVTLVAGVRISLPDIHWPSWVNVVLAAELIIIPLATAASGSVIHWNATVVGLILLAISLRGAMSAQLFTAEPHR